MAVYKPMIRFIHEEDGHNGKKVYDILFSTSHQAVNYAIKHKNDYNSSYGEATADVEKHAVFESVSMAEEWQTNQVIQTAKSKLTQEERDALGI